ncbi:MAG TPA: YdcF family protein [Verrucomicrobiota bacterium]|nr:YdcF family protein [Verrucomicrobiota bacterium]
MFYYKIILLVLQPLGLACILMAAAVLVRKHQTWFRALLGGAIVILWGAGNGWVATGMARLLEWRHLGPEPLPAADVIVIVGGGLAPQLPPRRSIEVDEAGDRTLFAARLYRAGRAPAVLCTSGIVPGSPREQPYAHDEAAMLMWLGVPQEAIWTEDQSRTTYENAKHGCALLRAHHVRRALLVTSALHMPRSMGVFRRSSPEIEFIPAPTDFRVVSGPPLPLLKQCTRIVPSAANMQLSGEVLHEFGGILYYKLRRWM